MQNIRKLCAIFDSLTKLTGCQFIWHTLVNDEIRMVPGIQLFHTCGYCAAVKRHTTALRRRCANGHWIGICRKSLEKRTSYVTTCHAGVTEAVVPIFREGAYLGEIFIGPFVAENGSPYRGYAEEYSRIPRFRPDFAERLQQHVRLLLEQLPPELPEHAFPPLCPPSPENCDDRIYKLLVHLRGRYSCKTALSDAARLTGLSVPRLQHLFRRTMGIPITEYLQRQRVGIARNLVEMTALPMSFIAEQCGISDQARMTVLFRKYFGESPSACRKNARK